MAREPSRLGMQLPAWQLLADRLAVFQDYDTMTIRRKILEMIDKDSKGMSRKYAPNKMTVADLGKLDGNDANRLLAALKVGRPISQTDINQLEEYLNSYGLMTPEIELGLVQNAERIMFDSMKGMNVTQSSSEINTPESQAKDAAIKAAFGGKKTISPDDL